MHLSCFFDLQEEAWTQSERVDVHGKTEKQVTNKVRLALLLSRHTKK
jgi:hypothetical protein